MDKSLNIVFPFAWSAIQLDHMESGFSSVLRGHPSGVSSLSFLPTTWSEDDTAHLLVTGDSVGTVRLWDARTEALISQLEREDSSTWPVISIQPSHGEPGLYIHSKGGRVVYANVATGDARTTSVVSLGGTKNICKIGNSFCGVRVYDPNIILGPGDGVAREVVVLDKREGYKIVDGSDPSSSHSDGRGLLMSLEVATGGGSFVTGSEAGHVSTWDMRDLSEPVFMAQTGTKPVLSVSPSPRGGDVLIAGTAGNQVHATYLNRVVKSAKMSQEGYACVRWRHDGKVIAAGCWDGVLRLFDGRRGASILSRLDSLQEHVDQVSSVAFSPVSNVLASGSKDGSVVLRAVY